jgi:hypothetical protein
MTASLTGAANTEAGRRPGIPMREFRSKVRHFNGLIEEGMRQSKRCCLQRKALAGLSRANPMFAVDLLRDDDDFCRAAQLARVLLVLRVRPKK